MSIQEKFEKAVNVIRNLPKNGSYQPSHELQLRFYGYYKQATEGFNYQPKPAFWEVVKRAKWDAWAKLGNMPKEEAMAHYVDELRKIVETMSYTDNVANFLNSLDNFYENVPVEDLEMLVGPVIEKIRSRPNSPLSGSPLASRDTSPSRVAGEASRDTSPVRAPAKHKHKHITITGSGSLETSPASSYSASPLPSDTDDEDDENFLDTQTEPDKGKDSGSKKNQGKEGAITQEFLRPLATASYNKGKRSSDSDLPNCVVSLPVPEPIHLTVASLQTDLAQLKNRLQTVEQAAAIKSNPVTSSRIDACNGDISRNETSTTGISVSTSETYKRAVDNLMKDMEQMQRRMTALENKRQQESRFGVGGGKRGGGGATMPKWWGLPLHTTSALLAWPLLILLISKWLSYRKQR